MIWRLSHRFDRRAVALADRHYSRQKPGTNQFMPAGRALVLFARSTEGEAVWGTSWQYPEFTDHRWKGAWICSIFRNEGAGRASALIRDAVAATRARYGPPPDLGIVTFVDPRKVREKRDPGHCFIIAGFRHDGSTQSGLLALRLCPSRMPSAAQAIGMTPSLFGELAA